MEDIVSKFSDALTAACDKSFTKARRFMKTHKHKTVPWWTEYLTITRKRVNAFRRRYGRETIINYVNNVKRNIKQRRLKYQAKIKNAKTGRGSNTVTRLYLQIHGKQYTNQPREK